MTSGARAGWQQAKISRRPLILDILFIQFCGVARLAIESLGQVRLRCLKPGMPPLGINGFETRGRNAGTMGVIPD